MFQYLLCDARIEPDIEPCLDWPILAYLQQKYRSQHLIRTQINPMAYMSLAPKYQRLQG